MVNCSITVFFRTTSSTCTCTCRLCNNVYVACVFCAGATLGEKPGPLALPPRPGFGKSGRPIRLRTNFFKVKIPSNMTLFHYDVEIQPKIPRKLKRKVMQEAIRQNSKLFSGQLPVFDGEKTMYCHKKLPEGKVHVPYILFHVYMYI